VTDPPGPPSLDQAREHFNLARSLQQQGQLAAALEHFQRAHQLAPQNPEALNALGACHRDLGELEESIAIFRRLIDSQPDNAMAYQNLAVSLQDQAKLDEALAAYRQSLDLKPIQPLVHSNALLCMSYHEGIAPQELFAAHREFATRYATENPPRKLPRSASNDGRIRVGYLSPDFRGHSVAFFIWPVLNNHDRSRFKVICYSDVKAPDALTELLRAIPEYWSDTSSYSDERLAQLVEEDGIDILVDLAGQTPGNRLPLLAKRIAPVQVTYLGCPNTTGLSAIDYRITDSVQDLPGMTEAFHSEQLIRLPRTFFTQLTISGLPDVAPPPALSSGRVTFAVFTNFCKVRPMMLKLWARLLRQVKDSRLLLQARSLRDRATREATLDFFAREGVGSDRLDLREYVEFPQYSGMYRDVDIVLDTYPFNGHTTTCQALWMGVPVVTLAGQVSRSRMGASVLGTIGLSELVAASEDDYVRIAAELARDLPRLSAMRSGLRDRVARSPILDCAGFTRELEAAYVEMIEKLDANR
jgi:predicted O-linked N-acetylglucosamine transferase (SPINDLY family)